MIRYKGFDDLVERASARAPSRAALLVCDDASEIREVTWRELAASVEARAEEIGRRGCACEAVLADGTAECVVEAFAAVRAGVQVALFDPLVPNRMMRELLQAVDADSVWACDDARREELERLVLGGVEVDGAAKGDARPGSVLFFTSGTTSSSKAVVLTDASLMSSAFNGSSLLPLTQDDVLACLLPLSHVFGFVCGLLWGLACGATVALGRGPRHYADDLAMFEPTAVAVVPRLLEYLVAREALNDGLRLVLVGAADCDDELLDAVRRRGIRASLGYGLTETSSGLALSTGDDFHAMTVCPDDELAIAEDGEILVKAPTCIMQGYYRDAQKTAQAMRGGVFHTGDKGYFDDEGLLHVTGRMRDVLTLPAGTKVFLPDYEAAVASALGERDIAVVLSGGVLVLVCGRLVRDRTDREIMGALEAALSAYPPGSRIGHIVRLGHALPRTAAGDVERWKVQEEMQNGNC